MSESTHSYYDWQISTLMLAYDVVQPLSRDDQQRLGEREQAVREELHAMVHEVLPQEYLENPGSEFPPEMVSQLTRATLRRAMAIVEGERASG